MHKRLIISRLDYDVSQKVDLIQQDNWRWAARRLTEKLQNTSQSQTCIKKRSWSLVVCYLSDSFQLSKSWRNHYISEVCSANWWDVPPNCNTCSCHWSTEWALFFSTMMIDFMLHNQHSKSWMNWAMKFCLICHIHLTSHQWTTTSSSILITFCREYASTTRGRQKMLSKSLSNTEAWIFMLPE